MSIYKDVTIYVSRYGCMANGTGLRYGACVQRWQYEGFGGHSGRISSDGRHLKSVRNLTQKPRNSCMGINKYKVYENVQKRAPENLHRHTIVPGVPALLGHKGQTPARSANDFLCALCVRVGSLGRRSADRDEQSFKVWSSRTGPLLGESPTVYSGPR